MKKKIISLGLVIEIITLSIIVSFMSPVAVFALSAGGLQSTIASIIISLMLQCGVAPVNQAWLNTLNTSYGVESSIGTIQDCINSGLLTQSGNTLIDTGLSAAIESQSAYTELGLSQIFTTSADDVAQGVIAGSGGVNIANVAINCGTLGTIGAYAGAASIGVGIGVLLNHAREAFVNFIRSGAKINYNSDIINNCPIGKRCYYTSYGSNNAKYRTVYYYLDNSVVAVGELSNIYQINLLAGNKDDTIFQCSYLYQLGEDTPSSQTNTNLSNMSNLPGQGRVYNWGTPDTNAHVFESNAMAIDYLQGIINGTIQEDGVHSPDLIGKNGNQVAEYDSESDMYVLPNFDNSVPNGYDMNPVNMNDYQSYVNNANNNTENGNIGEAIQGEQFNDLIDSLLVEPSIIPDQGVDTPDVPDRPIIPDQPETPGKDPITPEEQADVLEGITTPDLRSVFPFCIPFDLFSLLGELKDVNREAPVLVWEMPEELGGYSIILDFSMFDDAAALLRLLELAVFIIGLAVETRNLIGAKG